MSSLFRYLILGALAFYSAGANERERTILLTKPVAGKAAAWERVFPRTWDSDRKQAEAARKLYPYEEPRRPQPSAGSSSKKRR